MSWGPGGPWHAEVPKLGIDVGQVLSVKGAKADGVGLECIPRATKGVINDVNYT